MNILKNNIGFRTYYSPEGDGNCLPRCILKCLFDEELDYQIEIIRITADNLLANHEQYDQDELDREIKLHKCVNINHYCKELKILSTRTLNTFTGIVQLPPIWFGQIELIELTRNQNIEIWIYYDHLPNPLKFNQGNGNVLIEIAFENNHYFLLSKGERQTVDQNKLEWLKTGRVEVVKERVYKIEDCQLNSVQVESNSQTSSSSTINKNQHSSSSAPIKFTCPFDNCNLTFFKLQTGYSNKCVKFRQHIKSSHNRESEILRCKNDGCNLSFKNMSQGIVDFVKHISHCKDRFNCRICNKEFRYERFLKKHLKNHEKEDENKNKRSEVKLVEHQLNSVDKIFYVYNWLAILPEGIVKNVYNGRGRFNYGNSFRFMQVLTKMIVFHRKEIDCLESRILKKIIELKGKLIVNLVVSNVEFEESQDCEGKLIMHFHAQQADDQDWTLNRIDAHGQINFDLDNIAEHLNSVEHNVTNHNYIEFEEADFEQLFQLLYTNSQTFKTAYDELNKSNFYRSRHNKDPKETSLYNSTKNGKIHDLFVDYIEKIKINLGLNFQSIEKFNLKDRRLCSLSDSCRRNKKKPEVAKVKNSINNHYTYNWFTFFSPNQKKNIYTGRGTIGTLRFIHELIFLITCHHKKLKCLETQVVQKVIDRNGSLFVNLVVDNANEETAKDAEGKLIEYYHTRQADGEFCTLNCQLEHSQIDYNTDNIDQYLNSIEDNIQNHRYLEIHNTEFEPLFQLVYANSKIFRDHYQKLSMNNYKIRVRTKEDCFRDMIYNLFKNNSILRGLIANFINEIIKRRKLNFPQQ